MDLIPDDNKIPLMESSFCLVRVSLQFQSTWTLIRIQSISLESGLLFQSANDSGGDNHNPLTMKPHILIMKIDGLWNHRIS